MRKLCFYAMAGASGLAVDLLLLLWLTGHGVNPLAARALSLAVSSLLTWQINRRFTFTGTSRSWTREGLRYAGVTAVSQGASYACFAGLYLVLGDAHLIAAQLSGAVLGTLVNYAGHNRFTFAAD